MISVVGSRVDPVQGVGCPTRHDTSLTPPVVMAGDLSRWRRSAGNRGAVTAPTISARTDARTNTDAGPAVHRALRCVDRLSRTRTLLRTLSRAEGMLGAMRAIAAKTARPPSRASGVARAPGWHPVRRDEPIRRARPLRRTGRIAAPARACAGTAHARTRRTASASAPGRVRRRREERAGRIGPHPRLRTGTHVPSGRSNRGPDDRRRTKLCGDAEREGGTGDRALRGCTRARRPLGRAPAPRAHRTRCARHHPNPQAGTA